MFSMNVITEMRNRRLELDLQNDLDDIDTKIQMFRKNHKHRKQMIRKELQSMMDSGRKMSRGDLQEFDRRKNMKLAADIRNLEKDEDNGASHYDTRASTRRNSDESCQLPDLFNGMKINDTAPLPQPVPLPLIDFDSRSPTPIVEPPPLALNSKWRMLSRIILNDNTEPQKTEPAENHQTKNIEESGFKSKNETLNLPPIFGRVTSMNREMEPMREEDTESCCSQTARDDTSFSRRNSMVTSSMDFKANTDSAYLNRKRFSISVSELPLLNRRGSLCPSEANSKNSFQPPPLSNRFKRRASCSFSRISSSIVSEKDNLENRWKRLKAVAQKRSEQKEDLSCRKLSSMTVDKVVKSFITSMQQTSKKAKEKKDVQDLRYLKNCRYLRHPKCLY